MLSGVRPRPCRHPAVLPLCAGRSPLRRALRAGRARSGPGGRRRGQGRRRRSPPGAPAGRGLLLQDLGPARRRPGRGLERSRAEFPPPLLPRGAGRIRLSQRPRPLRVGDPLRSGRSTGGSRRGSAGERGGRGHGPIPTTRAATARALWGRYRLGRHRRGGTASGAGHRPPGRGPRRASLRRHRGTGGGDRSARRPGGPPFGSPGAAVP